MHWLIAFLWLFTGGPVPTYNVRIAPPLQQHRGDLVVIGIVSAVNNSRQEIYVPQMEPCAPNTVCVIADDHDFGMCYAGGSCYITTRPLASPRLPR